MTNPQLADMGDSFEDILSYLKGLNQSYDQMLITAAFLIASAKSEVCSALRDAEFQREGRTKAESFVEEMISDFDGVLAMVKTSYVETAEGVDGLLDRLYESTLKLKSAGQIKGGKERAKRSKSFQDKRYVLECWVKWQFEKDNYKSTAAFARDMLDNCEHLSDVKSVEGWCRSWRNVWKEIPMLQRDLLEVSALPAQEATQALLRKNAYIRENGSDEIGLLLDKIAAYCFQKNIGKK